MSEINQAYINQLADFEYYLRDGMVFTEEQKKEIEAICKQIMKDLN